MCDKEEEYEIKRTKCEKEMTKGKKEKKKSCEEISQDRKARNKNDMKK